MTDVLHDLVVNCGHGERVAFVYADRHARLRDLNDGLVHERDDYRQKLGRAVEISAKLAAKLRLCEVECDELQRRLDAVTADREHDRRDREVATATARHLGNELAAIRDALSDGDWSPTHLELAVADLRASRDHLLRDLEEARESAGQAHEKLAGLAEGITDAARALGYALDGVTDDDDAERVHAGESAAQS